MGKLPKVEILKRGVDHPGVSKNTHCPPNIGWSDKNTGSLQLSFSPFQVDQTLFYIHDRFTDRVRCEADRVYFYSSWGSQPGTVQLDVRSLPELHLLWAAQLPLDEVTQANSIEIRSIESSPSGVDIEFHNVETGRWAQVNLSNISMQ